MEYRGRTIRTKAVKTVVAENDVWRPKLWIDGTFTVFLPPYPSKLFNNEADAIKYAEEYGKSIVDRPPSSDSSALDKLLKDKPTPPKHFSEAELDRAGVTILSTDPIWLECQDCELRWSPKLLAGGGLPKDYWHCPNECNIVE